LLATVGVNYLGMKLHAGKFATEIFDTATGETSVFAVTVKPLGSLIAESPWDIQTLFFGPHPASSLDSGATEISVDPYSPTVDRETSPPSSCTIA